MRIFYISFMHPYKPSGRWQDVLYTKHRWQDVLYTKHGWQDVLYTKHRWQDVLYTKHGCVKEIPKNCMYKSS